MSFFFKKLFNINYDLKVLNLISDVLKIVFFLYFIFFLYLAQSLYSSYVSLAIDKEMYIYYMRSLFFWNFLTDLLNREFFVIFFLIFPLIISFFFFIIHIFYKFYKIQQDYLKYTKELVVFFGFLYFFLFLLVFMEFLSGQELYQSFFNIFDYDVSLDLYDGEKVKGNFYFIEYIKDLIRIVKI